MKESTVSCGFNEKDGCFTLTSSLIVPFSAEEVFPFFASAENLGVLTPDFLNFRILTEFPIEMKVGTLIDYRIQLHRIPIYWRTRISGWDPPYRFVDEQLKGPYLLWHHEHLFEEKPGNSCDIIDKVKYKVPGGRLVNHFFVKKDLLRIFNYRQRIMQEKFGVIS